MEGIFFEIHGNKFKPDPFADLGKASDEGVTHPMFLFGISETPLDRFFSLVIELSHPNCMPDVLNKLHAIHPDMLQDGFLMPLAVRALCKTWAFFAYLRTTFKLFIAFTVCCGILQNLIFRTDHTIKILIVNIFRWLEIAIFSTGTLVWKDGDAVAFEDFSGNCRRFVARIHYGKFDLWKSFNQAIVIQFKSHTVMDISSCHLNIENVTVFITRRVGLVGKLLLVIAFVENTTVRIRFGFRHNFRLWRLIVVIRKWPLSVVFSIFVDLCHELLFILFRSNRYFLFDTFFHVGTRFNVRTINENGFRRKHIACSNFIENPVENVLDRLFRKAMLEIVADRCKMRDFLRHCVAEKPPVCNVHVDLVNGSAQRRNAVQMLDDDHFEQHHWVTARSSIVRAIQFLHQIINMAEIHLFVFIIVFF